MYSARRETDLIYHMFLQLAVIGNKQGSLHVFLVVLGAVQSHYFIFGAYPQRQNKVDEFENDKGHDKAVGDYNADCLDLRPQKAWVTVESAVITGTVDELCSEEARHQHTHDATQPMAGEHV